MANADFAGTFTGCSGRPFVRPSLGNRIIERVTNRIKPVVKVDELLPRVTLHESFNNASLLKHSRKVTLNA